MFPNDNFKPIPLRSVMETKSFLKYNLKVKSIQLVATNNK